MEDIIVTSRLDFKTYLNISLRASYKLRSFIVMLVVLAVIEVSLFSGSSFDWATQSWVLGYFVGVYGLIVPAIIYFACKRNMNKMAALRETLIYTINEDKIELKAETMSSSSNWQYVTRLIEKENYFLIRTGAKAFHYLPKDGFQLREDMARLKTIAKEKGIKFSYN